MGVAGERGVDCYCCCCGGGGFGVEELGEDGGVVVGEVDGYGVGGGHCVVWGGGFVD